MALFILSLILHFSPTLQEIHREWDIDDDARNTGNPVLL